MARRDRSTRLFVTVFEDRTTPAVVTGTAGNDIITTQIAPAGGGLYQADILVNGVIAYSFTSASNGSSVTLPEQLTVNALGGHDTIDLGPIRDPGGFQPTIVHGGPGKDTVTGSVGHDELYGDGGADRLNGGSDEDVLVGDAADLSFDGGGGIDQLRFDNFAGTLTATLTFLYDPPSLDESLTMNGVTLTDEAGTFKGIYSLDVTGSAGADVIDLGGFPSHLVNVNGRGGNDTITVNAGEGKIDGGSGDDTITIAAGTTVDGGAGDDTLVGGFGVDTLLGGDGADTFVEDDFSDVAAQEIAF